MTALCKIKRHPQGAFYIHRDELPVFVIFVGTGYLG